MDRRNEAKDGDSRISGYDPGRRCGSDRGVGGKGGESSLSGAGGLEPAGVQGVYPVYVSERKVMNRESAFYEYGSGFSGRSEIER